MNTFQSLGLADHLLASVRDLGFRTPTPIQAHAIPAIAAGCDVACEAQTGSGKTATFVLPILHRLREASSTASARVLILASTRELALQVAGVFRSLAKRSPRPISVLGIIGGEPIEQQIRALQRGAEVLVATPGRLLDLAGRGVLDLAGLEVLVLDEADKLLDQGFRDELTALFLSIPKERQTLVFSATLPQRLLDRAAGLLRDPVTVRVDPATVGLQDIHQRVIEVERDQRRMLLQHLIKAEKWGRTLVFVATQRASENLSAKLRTAGFWSAALHGGLEQPERIAVLAQLKSGRVPTLVATDLAARGIDIPSLDVVVNFDLPRSPRDYLHRIGRTGRAGEKGIAVSFIDHTTSAHFRVIEKHNHLKLDRERIPGFELSGEAPPRAKGPAPVKGKRKSKKDKLREKAASMQKANE